MPQTLAAETLSGKGGMTMRKLGIAVREQLWPSLLGLVLVGLAVHIPALAEEGDSDRTLGKIERADPRFDDLVPEDAKLEILAEGFQWAEGPVWVPRNELQDGGYLLFSDIPRNAVMKWWEPTGVTVFLKPSGYTGEAPGEASRGRTGCCSIPRAGWFSASMATAEWLAGKKADLSPWSTITRANR